MTITRETAKIERILFSISILCVFLFNYTTLSIGKLLANGSILACIAMELAIYLKEKKIYESKELLAMMGFVIICIFSITYSSATKDTINKCYTMTIIFMYLVAFLNYLGHRKINADYAVNALLLACVLGAAYIVLKSDWRSGARVNNIIGNSNQVSAYISYTIPFIVYGIKEKKLNRYIGLFMIILFFFSIMISGSRSALVVCFMGVAIYYVLNTKVDKNILFRTILGLLAGAVLIYILYYLIMNNKVLYQIIGKRFISFFQIVRGKNSIINETSTQSRAEMRHLAFLM